MEFIFFYMEVEANIAFHAPILEQLNYKVT